MIGELTEVAILAYRAGRYSDAIELLQQASDNDRTNWFALLYLGMAFEKTDRLAESFAQFKCIAEECSEPQIRQKAGLGTACRAGR